MKKTIGQKAENTAFLTITTILGLVFVCYAFVRGALNQVFRKRHTHPAYRSFSGKKKENDLHLAYWELAFIRTDDNGRLYLREIATGEVEEFLNELQSRMNSGKPHQAWLSAAYSSGSDTAIYAAIGMTCIPGTEIKLSQEDLLEGAIMRLQWDTSDYGDDGLKGYSQEQLEVQGVILLTENNFVNPITGEPFRMTPKQLEAAVAYTETKRVSAAE